MRTAALPLAGSFLSPPTHETKAQAISFWIHAALGVILASALVQPWVHLSVGSLSSNWVSNLVVMAPLLALISFMLVQVLYLLVESPWIRDKIVAMLFATLYSLFIVVCFWALQRVIGQSASAISTNNLQQLALALQMYHGENHRFPPAVIRNSAGRPLYSWRVAILPYLGEEELYNQFNLDESWDSPKNIGLLPRMPRVYGIPRIGISDPSLTVYQVLTGPSTAFEAPEGELEQGFTDGMSKTILVVEAAQAVPWTKPADLLYGPDKPLSKFASYYSRGFHAAFADGSVYLITPEIDEPNLRALITRNGGEIITRHPADN